MTKTAEDRPVAKGIQPEPNSLKVLQWSYEACEINIYLLLIEAH